MADLPLYSICITHYNNLPTVRESLESILGQIDERFEVVVVDNLSSDGSREILQHFAAKGLVKLDERHCSRGRGRQIAFEESSGDYILSGVDLDDVFRPVFKPLLEAYHRFFEGKCLLMSGRGEAITILPRALVERVGGWRDIPAGEDLDLWARIAKEGELVRVPYHRIQSKVNPHSGFAHRARRSFDRALGCYVIGLNPRQIEPEAPTIPRKIVRLVLISSAYLAHLYHRKYKDNTDYKFRLATISKSNAFGPSDEIREAFFKYVDERGSRSAAPSASER